MGVPKESDCFRYIKQGCKFSGPDFRKFCQKFPEGKFYPVQKNRKVNFKHFSSISGNFDQSDLHLL